jgi:hypothetical protein
MLEQTTIKDAYLPHCLPVSERLAEYHARRNVGLAAGAVRTLTPAPCAQLIARLDQGGQGRKRRSGGGEGDEDMQEGRDRSRAIMCREEGEVGEGASEVGCRG